jgi:hypothetical protein
LREGTVNNSTRAYFHGMIVRGHGGDGQRNEVATRIWCDQDKDRAFFGGFQVGKRKGQDSGSNR